MAQATREALARTFTALGDPTRLDLVARLAAAGHATTTELAASYDVSFQAIAKHLKVLEEAGLVSRRKVAQQRPLQLEVEAFDMMAVWIERYRRLAERRFERLDRLLEGMAPGVPPSAGATHDVRPNSQGVQQ
jgi:DNA-binding transcriptional ArsR family regulator